MSTSPDILVELEKLRKDNKRIKAALGLLALALLAFVLAGHFHHPRVIVGTEFLLQDGAGNVVARLGHLGFGGTCLSLMTKDHGANAQLCVDDQDSSYLALIDRHDESRVSLTPGFTTYEPLGRIPAGLYIGKDSGRNSVDLSLGTETTLTFTQGLRNSIVVSSAADRPSINLFGNNGTKVWSTQTLSPSDQKLPIRAAPTASSRLP